MKKTCEWCGDEFTTSKSQQRFCCQSCASYHQHNEREGPTAMEGKTHSEETKRKMAEAAKGNTPSEEARRKMSEAHKGRSISKEQRQKISETLKEIGHAPPDLEGEEHPRFNPDKTFEYGTGWTSLAETIRERDGYECQRCGVDQSDLDRALDVHHIRPRHEFDSVEQANDPDNLVALCRRCHRIVEEWGVRPE